MASQRIIEVGEELPPFQRQTGFDCWNRFAAVNDEFVPIHMDDEAGRAAGFPTAFGMGNLLFSYLHNLIRQWLGEEGEILELGCQFRAANLKGQTVTALGRVTEVTNHGARTVAALELWTQDQDGNLLSPGHAKVALAV